MPAAAEAQQAQPMAEHVDRVDIVPSINGREVGEFGPVHAGYNRREQPKNKF
ncbi:hypothetical protein UFOVP1349_33 [uncultured Caudovirales phage]|uniref:Uncharacterized protein n=1 Tax=uncultured Caudovirales phage TaxID=2100421 RepID=A0A6J5RSC4_9CAUD|nr:hypothetical protein UFOVP925_10 [uncultured Caudovirales phage]CAB4184247.1 hypothetical protein UFOVP1097_39 [uncultured Caudovirales phage]CAB4200201.1 hypothetical protein UFOVP1349_33 [uncultured Caudovirales phage]CAB4214065.1 hypothetical protein UFOVP1456_13 [uncultured Caudovirales phage]